VKEGHPVLASEFPDSGHDHRKKNDQAKDRHEKPSHVSCEFSFALCGFILGFHGYPPSLKESKINQPGSDLRSAPISGSGRPV
jgi:hypothetical protein